MKKLSLKNFSILGLVLIGASALTTAMIPSNTDADNLTGPPGNGFGQPSSLAGAANGETVTQVASGVRSWTQTGPAGVANDGLSATSEDVLEDTATNQLGVGNQTSGGTTALANE